MSTGQARAVMGGDLQIVAVNDKPSSTAMTSALPPKPPGGGGSSNALVEYTRPVFKEEEEDLEIKLRRILDNVPVRVSNTSGSSAGSGSGDFHQMAPPRRVDDAILQALTQILQNQQNQNVPPPPPPPSEGAPGTYTWVANQLTRNNTPTYGGEIDPVALTEWFRALEKSFTLYDVKKEHKVKLASHFLVREADRWWSMTGPTVSSEPGFDWDRFKELVEARFYPNELKQQRLKELMELKQGNLPVQAFTDKFNELAHYATRWVKDDSEKAFFYLGKLSPSIKSMVRRDSTSFVSIYNDALWAESSLKDIENEARATSSTLGKRLLYPSSRPYTAPSRPYSSFSNPNKRRFTPNVQANRGVQPLTPNNNKNAKDRLCFNCKKPAHPGVKCFVEPIICFACNKPGHKANVCPEKKTVAPTTPVAPERPKGRIFVMSRAEAEAHPDIITGEELEDEFGDSYIVEDIV